MKTTYQLVLLFAVVLTGETVFAQTNKNLPGPTDYTAFSRFVTERNIFDPNRQPHYYGSSARPVTHKAARSTSAPTVALVGTMAYEKGNFAFFFSNDSEQKKVLPVAEKIADYTITEIQPESVTLETTNKTRLTMKVGEVLRQENGKWELVGTGEVPSGAVTTDNSASGGASAPASSALEANDVLKRLMQKREQEKK